MNAPYEQLLQSAKFFAAESVRNAIQAEKENSERWHLAVLHVVTSLEHSTKAMLASRHPVFIRDDLHRSQKSVGLATAFVRLKDRSIYGLKLTEKDEKRVQGAIKLRNEIAHGFTTENAQAIAARFFQVFGLLRELFRLHLNTQAQDFLSQEEALGLLSISNHIKELEKRANDALGPDQEAWLCTNCGRRYFVEKDDGYFCLFCHCEEPAWQCERCAEFMPETEALDTNELFDYAFVEGQADLVNNYGIEESLVCSACYEKLGEEANEQARQDEYYAMEEEYQYYIDNRVHKDRG